MGLQACGHRICLLPKSPAQVFHNCFVAAHTASQTAVLIPWPYVQSKARCPTTRCSHAIRRPRGATVCGTHLRPIPSEPASPAPCNRLSESQSVRPKTPTIDPSPRAVTLLSEESLFDSNFGRVPHYRVFRCLQTATN